MRAAGIALAYLLGLLFLQEAALRAVFPVPDVLGFNRLNYAGKLADHVKLPSRTLAHMTLWWWSEPDGASFTSALNLHGFRDRSWTLEKPDARRRIAFVGDSFVEGLGAADGETLVDQFARSADEQGLGIEVLNWGAGGFGLGNYARLIADAVPLFMPDDLMLVLYMNDTYEIPAGDDLMRGTIAPRSPDFWRPRLLHVLESLRLKRNVIRRWQQPAGDDPKPMNVQPRFDADPKLLRNVERFVEPALAEAMKAGRLNPAATNLLNRSERVLPLRVEVTDYLRALKAWLDERQVRLWVSYIPSLNQVSDAYLPAQRQISAAIRSPSLTADRFQQNARDIGRACRRLGLPYLDLTPELRSAEAEGQRLYWPYDGHMSAAGYRRVGEALVAWWQRERRLRH